MGGRKRGGEEGREREGMEEGRGKVTEGMRGTGQDMGWDGEEGKGKEGRGVGRRGVQRPQTSIPGDATANTVMTASECSHRLSILRTK